MPSKKQYNLVSEDAYDSKIPFYNDEAFRHGITFTAKYIGSLDVPQPRSREEIVAAMRAIRRDFKAKSMKKKNVKITISVDGVKVVLVPSSKSNQWAWDETLLHHPIYRIFYVSHDSQDLKIFSYIARDAGSSCFRCNVFKSSRKRQAMQIVRTVGQAFEVCHKLTTQDDLEKKKNDSSIPARDGSNSSLLDPPGAEDLPSSNPSSNSHGPSTMAAATSPAGLPLNSLSAAMATVNLGLPAGCSEVLPQGTPTTVNRQVLLLRSHVERLTAHVQLLSDQLATETAARLEAQTQNNQLLLQNTQLLDHIRSLVRHLEPLNISELPPQH